MSSVEFNPSIKNVTVANEKVKVTLEVDKSDVKEKLGDIADLEGRTITVLMRKEAYDYTIPYDRQTNKPMIVYVVDHSGFVHKEIEEQLSLIDNKDQIENRKFSVDREIVDEFIQEATRLEFPSDINPREALQQLQEGESFADVAKYFEMSETAFINQLEKARNHYAPFADAWNKKREEGELFTETGAAESSVD